MVISGGVVVTMACVLYPCCRPFFMCVPTLNIMDTKLIFHIRIILKEIHLSFDMCQKCKKIKSYLKYIGWTFLSEILTSYATQIVCFCGIDALSLIGETPSKPMTAICIPPALSGTTSVVLRSECGFNRLGYPSCMPNTLLYVVKLSHIVSLGAGPRIWGFSS